MINQTLRDELGIEIAQALGVVPVDLKQLQGGCIGEVYEVELPQANPFHRPSVVIKQSQSDLALEAWMLNYLRQHSKLPVPQVFYQSHWFLILEWMPGRSCFSEQAQIHAAELFAQVHQVRGSQFGLEKDTVIGGVHQPNPLTESWLDFFRDHRLLHMATQGNHEGVVPAEMLKRLERFCDNMDRYILEPEYPALLHGDAWTTNMLAENSKITAFLDPAIYYGHPEIELAFTTLFGTFGDAFFKRYDEINPISEGFFDVRRDIYNLYPLLVHVRIFGSSYLSGIDSTLKKLGY